MTDRLSPEGKNAQNAVEEKALAALAQFCKDTGLSRPPEAIQQLWISAYQAGYGDATTDGIAGTNVIINQLKAEEKRRGG